MLAFAPLLSETSFTARDHYEIVSYEELIMKVNTLMGKLKNLKLAGKLRSFTITKALQSEKTNLSDVRVFFDNGI